MTQQTTQEDAIKRLFKGYRKMNIKLQNELWKLGISVEHKKRHYVLRLQGTNLLTILSERCGIRISANLLISWQKEKLI